MHWKPLVVGQPTIPLEFPRAALEPDALTRFAKLAGHSLQTIRANTEFVNLLDFHPCKMEVEGDLPRPAANCAASLIHHYLAGRHVLVVGGEVIQALGLRGFSPLEWHEHSGGLLCPVPSLSHRCKWWDESREAHFSELLTNLYLMVTNKADWVSEYA